MRTASIVLLLFTWSIWGCGGGGGLAAPPTFPVSGTVTYKGEPVKNGKIGFNPLEHSGDVSKSGPDYGLDIVDGKFEGEVGAGEYVVMVYASWETGEMEPGDAGSEDVPVVESIQKSTT